VLDARARHRLWLSRSSYGGPVKEKTFRKGRADNGRNCSRAFAARGARPVRRDLNTKGSRWLLTFLRSITSMRSHRDAKHGRKKGAHPPAPPAPPAAPRQWGSPAGPPFELYGFFFFRPLFFFSFSFPFCRVTIAATPDQSHLVPQPRRWSFLLPPHPPPNMCSRYLRPPRVASLDLFFSFST